VLFVEPAQELLIPGVSQDSLDRVESVPQFVMAPGFVDEVLAGMAGRRGFGPAFAARDDMVPSRGNLSLAECAAFGHAADF